MKADNQSLVSKLSTVTDDLLLLNQKKKGAASIKMCQVRGSIMGSLAYSYVTDIATVPGYLDENDKSTCLVL